MKRFVTLALLLLAATLAFSACTGGGSMAPKVSPTPTSDVFPAGAPQGTDAPAPTPTVPPIPPDSIWTLTGTVTNRQTLEEGYYADYTVELDFYKLDGAYPSGNYTGDIYVTVKVDADDYIKEILSALPEGMASVNFDLSGYGLRNAISLNVLGFTEFQKEGTPWQSDHTKNAAGEGVSPVAESYVADTSFMMSFQAAGTAGGSGTTGAADFKIGDFDFSGNSEEDVRLRVIVEPDSVWGNDFYAGTGGSRKVQLFFDVNGKEFSGEGTLERQPNSESNRQSQLNRERLGEKYNVEETP
jgi:hypothetical protein